MKDEWWSVQEFPLSLTRLTRRTYSFVRDRNTVRDGLNYQILWWKEGGCYLIHIRFHSENLVLHCQSLRCPPYLHIHDHLSNSINSIIFQNLWMGNMLISALCFTCVMYYMTQFSPAQLSLFLWLFLARFDTFLVKQSVRSCIIKRVVRLWNALTMITVGA